MGTWSKLNYIKILFLLSLIEKSVSTISSLRFVNRYSDLSKGKRTWSKYGDVCTLPNSPSTPKCECDPTELVCYRQHEGSDCGVCICRPESYYDRDCKTCKEHSDSLLERIFSLILFENICLEGPKLYGERCAKLNRYDRCRSCNQNRSLICSENEICICPKSKYYDRSSKRCITKLNEICNVEKGSECPAFAKCKTVRSRNESFTKGKKLVSTCSCQPYYIANKYNTSCVRRPQSYLQSCSKPRMKCDPTKKLVCLGKHRSKQFFCKCEFTKGFVWSHFKKTCVGSEGSQCSHGNQECRSNAFCDLITKKCKCLPGYQKVPWSKQCLKICDNQTSSSCSKDKKMICKKSQENFSVCTCLDKSHFVNCRACQMKFDEEEKECRMIHKSPCGILDYYNGQDDDVKTARFYCGYDAKCLTTPWSKGISICIQLRFLHLYSSSVFLNKTLNWQIYILYALSMTTVAWLVFCKSKKV